MRKFTITLASLPLLIAANSAVAATPADACKAIGDARTNLVALINAPSPELRAGLRTKINAASDQLDQALAAMASGEHAAQAANFKEVWEAFKHTREMEIIPAVEAGKVADAKAIAKGVQAGRMKQMNAAMGCH